MELKSIPVLRPTVINGKRALYVEAGAKVEVFVRGSTFTTLAAGVTDKAGNEQSALNPLTTNADGYIEIYAPDGNYDVRITYTDGARQPDRLDVLWGDTAQQRIDTIEAKDATLESQAAVAEMAAQVQADASLSTQTLQQIGEIVAAGGVAYASRSELFADLAHGQNTLGYVYNDPQTDSFGQRVYVGIYYKQGASGAGSWTMGVDRIAQESQARSAEIGERAGRSYNAGLSATDTDIDPIGYQAFQLTNDGRTQVAALVVGTALDSSANQLRANGSGQMQYSGPGLSMYGLSVTVSLDVSQTMFAGSEFLVSDPMGFVVESLSGTGVVSSTQTPVVSVASATLLEQVVLPSKVSTWVNPSLNNSLGSWTEADVRGRCPNNAWTCTGSGRRPDGMFVVGNHGAGRVANALSSSYAWAPAIEILTADGSKIFREIPITQEMCPGIQSIQGTFNRRLNNDIVFVDKTNKTIRRVNDTGTLQLDVVTVAYTPNGCAAHDPLDAAWVTEEGTNRCHLYSIADGTLIRTLTGISSTADQIFYDETLDLLFATRGSNGAAGQLQIHNGSTGALLHTITLAGSESIEGCVYDRLLKRLYVFNDGNYHTEAKPPLGLLCIYQLNLPGV